MFACLLLATTASAAVKPVPTADALGSKETSLVGRFAGSIIMDKIDAKRLTAVGISFASPVSTNATDEGRAQNRRVELVANT